VKLGYLPLPRQISVTPKELILVEKDFFALASGNEPIAPARAEPLDLAALFGQWPCLQEARHTLYRHCHLYSSPCQKIAVSAGQHETTTAPLTDNRLVFV
jgi:hypothetical protein